MNRLLPRIGVLAALLLVIGVALLVVRGHERTLAQGRVALFELAPVDPRSMMQGDYMALAFAIEQGLQEAHEASGEAGRTLPRYALVRLDAEGRATLAELGDELPAAGGELLALRIRMRHGRPAIGPNAFFFQEGEAGRYEAARWGEFRVDSHGDALLTHLRDEELGRLGEIER
jgi:uncharacterized membrane-anchored protein